jgi:hypothetical protein
VGALTTLTTAPSFVDAGEKWYAGVGVRGLQAGGELGMGAFGEFELRSAAPVSPSPEQEVAWWAFTGFLETLEAFYALEIDFGTLLPRSIASRARGDVKAALDPFVEGDASFSDPQVEKRLRRAHARLLGVVERFFQRSEASHYRNYAKVAEDLATALEAMEPQP